MTDIFFSVLNIFTCSCGCSG